MKHEWQKIDLNLVTPEPWRNGGGTTRMLLACPSAADWRIRCSVATVATSGPFSVFKNVNRWFSVLEGAGVSLTIDNKTYLQTRDTGPLHFSGESQTDCTLINGETEDFNLMLQGCEGQMQLVHQQALLDVKANQWIAVYSHDSDTTIKSEEAVTTILKRHLSWLINTTDRTLSISSDKALWMQVTL